MSTQADTVRETFAAHGQGHLFSHWDTLTPDERKNLLESCSRVDFRWISNRTGKYSQDTEAIERAPRIEPAPVIRLAEQKCQRAQQAAARAAGEMALCQGRLAAFLVAGGQGTRLGFDGPKGCYPVGPNSGKTLFQWHAEQIRARARRYGCTIPWYIMTSEANHTETTRYFEENGYLGFPAEDVMIFRQGMVPSIDFKGKLMLAAPDRIAMNPDGHGGSLTALYRSGALENMRSRGIDTISYFQVDNPLVTICDPVFAGYHLLANGQMSSKVLTKCNPEEKVGHICIQNGKLTVIEYSDMPPKLMAARDPEGELLFWAGSIAIHMINVDFAEEVARHGSLPWHTAHKAVPYFDGQQMVRPDSPNALKFETFVFDALPLAARGITLEVDRAEEFAPVKNATGFDSVDSCRQALSNRFASWLESCGQSIPRNEKGDAEISIEIAPTFALDAEELTEKHPLPIAAEKTLTLPEET